MAKLIWDKTTERLYETGVSKGVLYVHNGTSYGVGVAWNGITGVTENPTGAEATALYADNIKYLNLMSAEEFGCTIEAYMYPEEFEVCDGSAELSTASGITIGQQPRKMFGLCYRTEIGNDTENNDYGYKLHLVYGCLASPSSKAYSTMNDSPEAITFSWDVKTTPVEVEGFKPTATVVIDSNKCPEDKLKKIEAALYGTDAEGETPATNAKLLLPSDILDILKAA